MGNSIPFNFTCYSMRDASRITYLFNLSVSKMVSADVAPNIKDQIPSADCMVKKNKYNKLQIESKMD